MTVGGVRRCQMCGRGLVSVTGACRQCLRRVSRLVFCERKGRAVENILPKRNQCMIKGSVEGAVSASGGGVASALVPES